MSGKRGSKLLQPVIGGHLSASAGTELAGEESTRADIEGAALPRREHVTFAAPTPCPHAGRRAVSTYG